MSFFAASKLLWYAVEPSHLLVWIALAAALFRNRVLAATVALSLVLLLTVPVGNWALRPLENLYPRPDWPAHIDGILVLGEGLSGEVLASRGAPGVGQDGGTLLAAVARKLGWPLLPWPSDYLTLSEGTEGPLSLALNLAHLDKAVHEAVGLLAYRLSGKGA